jgi:hypothetical protein
MRKITLFWLAAVMAVLVMALPSNATEYIDKMSQSGMPFLTIEPNGRTAAMGGAGTCIAEDASAMFANPAGLAMFKGLDVAFGMNNWIADIKQYSGAAAYNFGKWGTFGASFVWMDYGNFTETIPYVGNDPVSQQTGYVTLGNFTVKDYALGLSYARKISNQFSFGAQIKYAYEDLYKTLVYDRYLGQNVLSNNQEQMYAFDFGTLYYTGWKDLRFGMSIRNFSRQGKFVDQRFELPLTMTMGMAMNVMTVLMPSQEKQKLTLAVDWLHPRNWRERVHVGAEYQLQDMLFVRAGYKFNYSEEGLTAGVGVAKSMGNYGLRLDYSYGAFGDFFGSVNRLTIGISMK